MTKTTHINSETTDIKADIRLRRLDRLSNMAAYLSRIANHPITKQNRHEELSWGEKRGREVID